MITQDDLNLITDESAFTPRPVEIEAAGWVEWAAGIGFILMLVFLVMAP